MGPAAEHWCVFAVLCRQIKNRSEKELKELTKNIKKKKRAFKKENKSKSELSEVNRTGLSLCAIASLIPRATHVPYCQNHPDIYDMRTDPTLVLSRPQWLSVSAVYLLEQ